MTTNLLSHALAYRERGWSVLPVRGKRATLRSWNPYRRKLPTAAEVKTWFSEPDQATGIGLVCGGISGDLAVRDFDAEDHYQDWARGHSQLAAVLPTVRTRRGMHVYCRVPGARTRKYADGELRAEGAYTLAPPSLHPVGPTYEWIIPLNGQLRELDPVAVGLVPDLRDVTHAVLPAVFRGSTGGLDSDQAIRLTLPTGPGQRNRRLFEYARALRFNVGITDLSEEGLWPYFQKWFVLAKSIVRTKDPETSWQDFLTAIDNAKERLGTVAEALALAEKSPPPYCAGNYEKEPMKRLVRMLAAMQTVVGDRPFSASCSQVATWLYGPVDDKKIIQRHRVRANRFMLKLIYDGVLVVVKKGIANGPQGSDASEYRFRDW